MNKIPVFLAALPTVIIMSLLIRSLETAKGIEIILILGFLFIGYCIMLVAAMYWATKNK